MKASELRIGNYVCEENESEEYYELQIKDWLWIRDHDAFEPIPLTEEWLLKFGFEHQYSNYWELDYFEIDKTKEGLWVNSVNCNEYIHGEPFKHVHQLQNLYFALTGEELKIN